MICALCLNQDCPHIPDLQQLRESDLPLKVKRKLVAAMKATGARLGPLLESEAFRTVRLVSAPRSASAAQRSRYVESDARWNRIFAEKFADPSYYSGLQMPWSQSSLADF